MPDGAPPRLVVIGDGATARALVRLATAKGIELDRWASPGDIADDTVVVEDGGGGLNARTRRVAQLSAQLPAATVVVVCTTGDPVTDLASRSETPARIVGLHLSSATAAPQLAEVVPGLATAASSVERAMAAARELGLDAVVAPDRPGFLVDALLRPYLNQVVQALDDGVASAEDIDAAVRLGLGHPIGPLALLDRLGLEEHLTTTAALHAATGDAHLAPPPLLRRMVAAGWTGVAAGRGFFASEEAGSDG